ncbi:MAG TPA: glycosyltransferase [Candidatus Binatia bacterium]|nr:glycosyltransferase [Candidatus Binatia bacterium]
MSEPRLLSVIVPVYNEVGTVRTLLERVMAVPLAKEVIVVDDASTDGTRRVVEALAREPLPAGNHLVVLGHERNQGKGAAVRTALPHVRGDVALIQDADLEYDPAEYPRLVAPIVDGRADVVFGSRFMGGPRPVVRFWHAVGNRVLTLVSNMLTDLALTDMETCYKVFRADVLKRLPIRSNRFGLEPELTAKIAHLRCRVFEMPIAYHGRQYSEGKKIGWKDGVSALWTIFRFAVVPDVGRDDEEFATLRRVQVLHRYTEWVWEMLRPHVGRRVLEVGSATGAMTRYLATREHLIATDVDPEYVAMLRRDYAETPNVEVRPLDLARFGQDGLAPGTFDTVVSANFLGNVDDDARMLRAMRNLLQPGGRVVLVVPALGALFGSIDRAIGHRRRYSRKEIGAKLEAAGLTVEELRFFNVLGMAGWFVNARLLGRRSVPGLQARINDRLVPLLRLERHLGPPLGMSLLAVARARD